MRCLGTWFNGGLGSARLTVGSDNLTNLFPKAVEGWMMRKQSRVDGCSSITVFLKIFDTVRDQYQ